MPQNTLYTFTQAANANTINEKEYFLVAHNGQLTFPNINSCIVIIFYGNNSLVGFHLVLTDSQNPGKIIGSQGAATTAQVRQSIDFLLGQAGIVPDQNSRYLVAGDFNNQAWQGLMEGLTNGLDLGQGTWNNGQGNLTATYAQNTFAVNWA